MKKTALLALVLAMVMLLTGCSLVAKDAAVDAATEIVRTGDKAITKAEVQARINNYLNDMASFYAMYGYSIDPNDPELIAQAREQVIADCKESLVRDMKIDEFGLRTLTDEDNAQIAADTETEYQYYMDAAKSAFFADTTLEGDELTKAIEDKLTEIGITKKEITEAATVSVLSKKLDEYIVRDVAVTEEEVKADYDSKVASAKETYENNASAFANAMNQMNVPMYFAPDGVRLVKQILIKYTDDDQAKIDALTAQISALTEETPAKDKADLEAQLTEARNAALANIAPVADDVIAQLQAGADWDALAADKNQDPGMQSGVTAERGYAVCKDMTGFDPAFVQAAMALEKVGDVTDKIVGEAYGYYIIRYVGDVTPGEMLTYDSQKDSIHNTLLTAKKNELLNNTISSWISETNFKVDLNALAD